MSQEFEKKVLEKLDSFEGRFDKIENTLDENTKTLKEHTGILNENTKTLKEHTKILNDHTEQFKIVREDIYKTNNNIIRIAQKVDEIEDVVKYNTKAIKKLKEDSEKKMAITLKAYEQLNTKVNMNQCIIGTLKSKNFENDVRITALEDTIKQRGLIA